MLSHAHHWHGFCNGLDASFKPFTPVTFRHSPHVPYCIPKKHVSGQLQMGMQLDASMEKIADHLQEYYFDFAEHGYIGDHILLKLDEGPRKKAWEHTLTLPNGLRLTYGQINGLAGAFYGTKEPIRDGAHDAQRADRF